MESSSQASVMEQQQIKDKGVIYIGHQDGESYMLDIINRFQTGEKNLVIKARGSWISKAVSIQQIVLRKNQLGIKEGSVKVSTEELEIAGKASKISAIYLTLTK